jgi:superfamily I DNA/RNA helicase
LSLSGINIRGKRSTRLKINYRTTEQIREFAVKVLGAYEFDDFSGSKASMAGDTSLLTGNEPVYEIFETEEREQEFVVDQIRACFGKVRFHEVCLTARTKNEVDRWLNLLEEAKIPSINLHDVNDLSEASDRVIVSTMHGLKGLEFKELLVTGLSQDAFPYKPKGYDKWSKDKQDDFIKAESALMYVSFSRAISTLVITGVGTKMSILDK